MIQIEVCAGSVASAIAAEQGGADRIELCAALPEGGTTPSYGMVKRVLNAVSIPLFPIIRPRSGDFVYSSEELAVMAEDIKGLKALGVAGFSLGVLTREGTLDRTANAMLIALAGDLPVTLHRAFDRVECQAKELEVAIELGFLRVLTSGGAIAAPTAESRLAALVRQAGERIIIMAGAGVRPENARQLVMATGVKEIHGTFIARRESEMTYQNPAFPQYYMEEIGEYAYMQSDEAKIRSVVDQLKML